MNEGRFQQDVVTLSDSRENQGSHLSRPSLVALEGSRHQPHLSRRLKSSRTSNLFVIVI